MAITQSSWVEKAFGDTNFWHDIARVIVRIANEIDPRSLSWNVSSDRDDVYVYAQTKIMYQSFPLIVNEVAPRASLLS
jgi:hypothetical protein